MKRYFLKSLSCVAALCMMDFAAAQEKMTIIAATDATNAPYEMRDEQGQLIGFDVDLIRAIAANQHMDVTVLPHSWSSIFDALNAGEKDIIVAPLTITEERRQRVDFTIPYILPTRTALIKPDTVSNLDIHSFYDLDKGTIAAKGQTTNQSALESFFGVGNPNIVPVGSQYLAFKAMMSDEVNSAFGDTLVVNYHASFVPDVPLLAIVQPMNEPVEAGFAIRKGNTELKQIIDNGIRGVLQDGTYETLAIKWFGEEQGKLFTRNIKQFLGLGG